MATSLTRFGIDKLGIEERLALIDELWESIALENARSSGNARSSRVPVEPRCELQVEEA